MAKSKLSKIAELERIVELARNKKNELKPYNVNDTIKNIGGTSLDKQERVKQLGRNIYTKQKPYDSNSI